MTRRTLYFAYGSNMSRARMLARVPNAEEVGTATLRGWRLVERLYADIEPCAGAVVEGVLWAVDAAGVDALDRFEGFPSVYDAIYETATCAKYGRVDVMVYIMTDRARWQRDSLPYPDWYRAICTVGADEHGIRVGFGAKPYKAKTKAKEVAR